MATNHHEKTGIPFGYIRHDSICPELLDQLLYTHGTDLSYKEALADHLAQRRREHEAAEDELRIKQAETGQDREADFDPEADGEEFDEDFETQEFNDSYQCDEPTIEGEHEGVKYRTSWLGGALNLWVFESPVLTECRPCSMCVPNAGNLDQVGNYLAYGVPASWLHKDFLEDALFQVDWKVEEIDGRYRYAKVDDVQISQDSWSSYDEALEAAYKAILQKDAPCESAT